MANRLARETSPYLLQHSENPVDWYPWGPEALERARQGDKPIFLSIGYAACHWCHVMERESFEDPETAEFMNRLFVNVKVDREERPDLDQIYMQAVIGITGRGGWPMSVWLTPEGVPFYGGTYFPNESRGGMPSFRQVLDHLAEAWRFRRGELLASVDEMVSYLQQDVTNLAHVADALEPRTSDDALAELNDYFDWANGGWGRAPKFPQGMAVDFLLHRHARRSDALALRMARATLDAMADGGLYDQLGGGFHRYSVDPYWLVPHFEKMLYDNALLARAYLHAWRATGDERYRRITEETLDYVLREMTHPDGGFYSTQDADSEGEEGKFFTWTSDEVRAALESRSLEPDLFVDHYGVTAAGNFEGKNVLQVTGPLDELADRHALSEEQARKQLDEARQALFEERERRVHPATDDKVLTAWNGLMLCALAEAAAALGREDYLAAARRNAEFLLAHVRTPEGRLYRSWRNGEAKLNGYLEDYAGLATGLLALYEADFEERWFLSARELVEIIYEHFAAPEAGFYDTSDDHEQLVTRPRDLQDNAVPSGNAMAVTALLRLAALTGEGRYQKTAEKALRAVAGILGSQPMMFGQWLTAYELALAPAVEVAIVGDPQAGDTRELLSSVREGFRPFLVVAAARPAAARPGPPKAKSAVPLLQDRPQLEGRATAYVCRDFSCRAPVTTREALVADLLQSEPTGGRLD